MRGALRCASVGSVCVCVARVRATRCWVSVVVACAVHARLVSSSRREWVPAWCWSTTVPRCGGARVVLGGGVGGAGWCRPPGVVVSPGGLFGGPTWPSLAARVWAGVRMRKPPWRPGPPGGSLLRCVQHTRGGVRWWSPGVGDVGVDVAELVDGAAGGVGVLGDDAGAAPVADGAGGYVVSGAGEGAG